MCGIYRGTLTGRAQAFPSTVSLSPGDSPLIASLKTRSAPDVLRLPVRLIAEAADKEAKRLQEGPLSFPTVEELPVEAPAVKAKPHP